MTLLNQAMCSAVELHWGTRRRGREIYKVLISWSWMAGWVIVY